MQTTMALAATMSDDARGGEEKILETFWHFRAKGHFSLLRIALRLSSCYPASQTKECKNKDREKNDFKLTYIFIYSFHSNFSLFFWLLSAISYSLGVAAAHRCYVCGRDAEEPFKDSRLRDDNESNKSGAGGGRNNVTIPSKCDEFERTDNVEKFALECPSGYSSCLTQIDGKFIQFFPAFALLLSRLALLLSSHSLECAKIAVAFAWVWQPLTTPAALVGA